MTGGFREHKDGCPREPALRRMQGCDEDAERVVFKIGELEHRRCPLHYLDEPLYRFLGAFAHYRAGFLPEAGGIADQSATFLVAASILAGEIGRLMDERENS